MSGLSLSLLGPFLAVTEGGTLPAFRTRFVQALLIYLACQPERHRREALMALLWPDASQPSAQQNLRQILYYLRKALPEVSSRDGRARVPLVLADRDFVQLNPDAAVEVDVHRLMAPLHPTQFSTEELVQVAALYRGDFLADFYLPDSNPFEEWAAMRRETYRQQVLAILERLGRVYLRDEEFDSAERYARLQLDIDPLYEAGHRQLIELLARNGRRSAALAQFDAYRQLLHNELGAKPGSETLALVEAIQTGELLPIGRRPDHIRGYKIQEEVGRGSFGVVFRATQPAIGRDVAIKVIPAQYADDVGFIRRFEAEAQTIARLEHPQIVPLYDYWREPGNAYLVMRYLRGGNLKVALAKAAWSLEQSVQLVEQVAAALYTAHRHGIVHRDVKPANILLDEEGNAYLSDFSLAKLFQPEEASPTLETLTGTPEYLSPEQAQNGPTTPLSDQYSLGLVVYEVLSGRPPFTADSLLELLHQHLHEPLPSLHERHPEIPIGVDDVLRRATAKRPQERFANILTFAKAFRAASLNQDKMVLLTQTEPLLEVTNPYKGLLAFTEADAPLFYGREAAIKQLLAWLTPTPSQPLAEPDPSATRERQVKGAGRFLAVVGPSGSGKSSLVKAGLVPALRQGAIPGSERWFIVDVIPGSHPFEEIETALLRIAINPPPSLSEQLQVGECGLLDAVRRILPADGSAELLLIIDQFEELFTLVADRAVTGRFLDSLYTAVTDPFSPLRVIVTLRADFYDRPLIYPGLSELMQQHTEVVVPLTADELVQAIERPAARVGVSAEPELVAALVADVNEQPGALPLLQYTLSELFDQRASDREGKCLTLNAYRQLGGISGALSQRAEAIYNQLDAAGQTPARALFTRLTTLGEGVEDTRRRVLRAELLALDIAGESRQSAVGGRQSSNLSLATHHSPLATILDWFGRARLLSFDHDPVTRGPTVEIAHEALLRAWPRLRSWLDENRAELRLGRLLTQAAAEWEAAQRDDGFLLRGARLDQFAPLAGSTVALTSSEQDYLNASLVARQARRLAEETRRQNEIATAQQLAETERQRANEQGQAARRLRQRAALLAGALVLAIILAIAALLFSQQANQNAVLAQQRQVEAENNTRLATSRELALAAETTLDSDAELSLLLALQALKTEETKEAQEALHQALQTSRTLRTFHQPTQGSNSVVVGPDGPLPVTLSPANITVWDPGTGNALYILPDAGYDPELAFYTDIDQEGGKLFLFLWRVGGEQMTFKVWTLEDERLVTAHTLPISNELVARLSLSPDGQLLAVVYENGSAKLWDTNTGRPVATLDNDAVQVNIVGGVIFNQDGSQLAILRDNNVSLWDVAASVAAGSGQKLNELITPVDHSAIMAFAFIDEITVATGSGTGWLELWDLSDPSSPLFSQHVHDSRIARISVSTDRSKIVTTGVDGFITIWSIPGGELLLTLPSGLNHSHDVYFSPDGTQLTTIDNGGITRIWDARLHTLGEVLSFDTFSAVALSHAMQISPNGEQLAITSDFNPASLWDASTGTHLQTLPDTEGAIYSVAYSPDGTRLAGVGEDSTVYIWNLATGEELLTFSAHGPELVYGAWRGILDVSFSPDGSQLATAGADGIARVWDAQTGEERLSFTAHTAGLYRVVYSPDGRLIATSSDQVTDGTVRVWDAQTGEQYYVVASDPGMEWALAFSPDSSLLATGGDEGVVTVWNATTGEEHYTLPNEGDIISDLAFTPDGQFLITAGKVLRVWRAKDGQEVISLSNDKLWWFKISSDGRYLYAQDSKEILRGFVLRLEDAVALANERLTRWWRPEECERYLHTAECPPAPPKFSSNE
jgi:WD40 repeat protein/serine/threonine protein kinase/DNA-binding SARP family transcriptional activator